MNEVINITPSEPNLSTANVGDSGTIKLNNLPPLDTNNDSGPKKSVNFGPGIEMLMNDKRRSGSPKSDIKLSDLESLETNIDLNDSKPKVSRKDATDAIFSTIGTSKPQKISHLILQKKRSLQLLHPLLVAVHRLELQPQKMKQKKRPGTALKI